MNMQIKTLTCTILDEYGGRFDGAFVAIRGASIYGQLTSKSEDCESDYVKVNKVEKISYHANYWYNMQTRADGMRSRPLKIQEDGAFTDVLLVDMSHPEIVAILELDLDTQECKFTCAESDLKRRFI
jgi:hypothetical protein